MSLYLPAAGTAVRPPDLRLPQRQVTRPDPGPVPRTSQSGLGELSRLVWTALLFTFVIKTFLLQAFFIPSESMIPTLHEDDRVLVEKVSYRFRPPERGEVIVFRRLEAQGSSGWSFRSLVRGLFTGLGLVQPEGEVDYIKRVIGLPGETVEVRDGTVLVNGQPLVESYAEPEIRDSPPVVVPPEAYFMMGDNRMNSLDSRFGLGFVSDEQIVGRAFAILWPPRSATLSLDRDYPGVDETSVASG